MLVKNILKNFFFKKKKKKKSTATKIMLGPKIQTVAAICFTVHHVKDFLLHLFSLAVTFGPVVASTATIFGDKDVFRVVQPRNSATFCVAKRFAQDPFQVRQKIQYVVIVSISLKLQNGLLIDNGMD